MSGIRVIIFGLHSKKLGVPVTKAIHESSDFRAAVGIVRPGDDRRSEHGNITFSSLRKLSEGYAHKGSTVVFYAVKGADLLPCLEEAYECGFVRHVIGSTGLDDRAEEAVSFVAQRSIVVHALNFSAEANILASTAAQAALALPDHDVEIAEAHHRRKMDAPSGTALMIARAVANARCLDPDEVIQHGWPSAIEERPRNTINITAMRGGGVPGEHYVHFLGEHATLTLTQRAISSQSYAIDALKAIRWASEQKISGLYDMLDVLGISSE